MPRYWVMRTDKDSIPYLSGQLEKGKLRQGWGYLENQHLELIRKRKDKRRKLNADQKKCWRGNRRMLNTEEGSIQVGDIILTPHLPERGCWSIIKVVGDYFYEIDQDQQDFGHTLPVELLTKERPVNPYEEAVSAKLRQTMRCQSRLWNIDYLKPEVDHVIGEIENGATSQSIADRIPAIYTKLEKTAWEEIQHHYHGSEIEKPCVILLQAIFGDEEVDHTGGKNERGADAICRFTDPIGTQHSIAVQIKMWDWAADNARPLEQIEEAYQSYEGITSGVVITTAEECTKKFSEELERYQQSLGIPIRIIYRKELIGLFVKHLPELAQIIDAG